MITQASTLANRKLHNSHSEGWKFPTGASLLVLRHTQTPAHKTVLSKHPTQTFSSRVHAIPRLPRFFADLMHPHGPLQNPMVIKARVTFEVLGPGFQLVGTLGLSLRESWMAQG